MVLCLLKQCRPAKNHLPTNSPSHDFEGFELYPNLGPYNTMLSHQRRSSSSSPAPPRSSTKATRKNALFFLILSKPNLHCFLRLFEKLVFGIYIMNTYNWGHLIVKSITRLVTSRSFQLGNVFNFTRTSNVEKFLFTLPTKDIWEFQGNLISQFSSQKKKKVDAKLEISCRENFYLGLNNEQFD